MVDAIEPRVDPNLINEAGDVITEAVTVTTQDGYVFDVSNFCLGITLFEDIFSNVMVGEALFMDSANLITKVPFQGIEFITISYRTPSFVERIAKSFKVTSLKDRAFTATDREQMYVLGFMSNEGARDNIINLNQKFSGTTDQVVSKIWQDHLTLPRFLSDSASRTTLVMPQSRQSSSITFVAPNWTPLQTINWVASRSFDVGTELNGFQLFESNKAFYFRNLDELIETQDTARDVFARYVYYPGAATVEIPRSNVLYTKPELLKQYSIVRKIKPFTQFDILEWQNRAFVAGKLITHDIALKTYNEYFFDYYNPYTKEITVNKNPTAFPQTVMRNADCMQTMRTKQYKLHNEMQDPLFEKWVLQRNSLLYELSGVNLEIEVPGRTDIEVGRLVDFVYPKSLDKMEGTTAEWVNDEFMTARYLVTSIRHDFSLNTHTMYLELARYI